MAHNWKPGDVALIGGHRALRIDEDGDPYFIDSTGLHWRREDDTAERLIVIALPPGARAGWPTLIDALKRASEATGYSMIFGGLIAQIEAQTSTRPEEPKGLGAIVENAEGDKFVRVAERCDGWAIGRDWQRIGGEINAVRNFGWRGINAVRVLSEGLS